MQGRFYHRSLSKMCFCDSMDGLLINQGMRSWDDCIVLIWKKPIDNRKTETNAGLSAGVSFLLAMFLFITRMIKTYQLYFLSHKTFA